MPKATLPPTVPAMGTLTREGAMSSLKLWDGQLVVIDLESILATTDKESGEQIDTGIAGVLYDGSAPVQIKVYSKRLASQFQQTDTAVGRVTAFGRGFVLAPYTDEDEGAAIDLFSEYQEAIR